MPRRPNPANGIEYQSDRVHAALYELFQTLYTSERNSWLDRTAFPDQRGRLAFAKTNLANWQAETGLYTTYPQTYAPTYPIVATSSAVRYGTGVKIQMTWEDPATAFAVAIIAMYLGPFGYGPASLRTLTTARVKPPFQVIVPFRRPSIRRIYAVTYAPAGAIDPICDFGEILC